MRGQPSHLRVFTLLLAERLRRCRAMEPLPSRRKLPLPHPTPLGTRTLRQAVGQEPAAAALRRSLRAAAAAHLAQPFPRQRSGYRAACVLHNFTTNPSPRRASCKIRAHSSSLPSTPFTNPPPTPARPSR